MAQILATHTLLPEYAHTADEALACYQQWVSGQSPEFQKKALGIFQSSAIKEKHTIAPAEVLFSQRSFEESNALYRENAITLGTRVLRDTLDKASIAPEEIDCIISTSCTGFMIPSFDMYVINALGLRRNVRQMPITELGCAAGVAALIFAHDYVRAYPDKKVAVITLEFPSNTVQLNDFAIDNIVGTALFADGVACAIVGNGGGSECPYITDVEMYSVADTTNILGYNMTNHGLRMNLNKCIPRVIEKHFETIVSPFLERNSMTLRDVDYYLAHPGGIKILDKIEAILKTHGRDVAVSRHIMETYGNMSSSTVLYILNQYMQQEVRHKTGLMLSFGPGFSAHQLLLEWR